MPRRVLTWETFTHQNRLTKWVNHHGVPPADIVAVVATDEEWVLFLWRDEDPLAEPETLDVEDKVRAQPPRDPTKY